MTIFWELLPIYLLGNFHCLGMCGPLVAFLGKSPWRIWYFLGRAASFSLVGGISALLGIYITAMLDVVHVGFLFTLGLGIFMILAASVKRSFLPSIARREMEKCSLLLLRGGVLATFCFGVATVLLPCGQSAIVFAACSLSGSGTEGVMNGFSLAFFTTPALLFSMETARYMQKARGVSEGAVRGLGVAIGVLSCLRAFSSIGWIPHAGFDFFGGHIVFW